MGKFAKRHLLPLVITLLSVLGAIWVEPFIDPDGLSCLVLVIAMTLGAILWKGLQDKRPLIIISLLAIIFQPVREIVFIRQLVLTVLIAGALVGLLHLFGFDEPRNRG